MPGAEEQAPRTANPELRTGNRERTPSAGFTLLEVVVAVALLGLILATALELLAVGLRSAKASEDYTEATLLARRTLTELSQGTLTPGATDGSSGGYRWVAEIAPESEEAGTLPVRLYTLRVRVAWPGKRGEKGVELITLHAAARDDVLSGIRTAPQHSPADATSETRRGRVP